MRRRTADVRDRDAAAYLLVCTTDREGTACCGDRAACHDDDGSSSHGDASDPVHRGDASDPVRRDDAGDPVCRGDAGDPVRRDDAGDPVRRGDGAAVATAAREWLDERDALWTAVVPIESSCLALCDEDGAAVGVLPHGEWFSGVAPVEVPALLADVFGPRAEQVRR